MFWHPLHPWFLGGKEDQPSYTSAFAERGKVSKPFKKKVKLQFFLKTLRLFKCGQKQNTVSTASSKVIHNFFIVRVLKVQFILHSCKLCWFKSLSHWDFWKKKAAFFFLYFSKLVRTKRRADVSLLCILSCLLSLFLCKKLPLRREKRPWQKSLCSGKHFQA